MEEKKEDEKRGLAVASREPAREDRWRREPGNLGTTEFSRAKLPAATGRGDIHTRCFWGLGTIEEARRTRAATGAPSEKRITPLKGMSDTTRNGRQMRVVGQESKYYDRVALRGPVSRQGPLRVIPRHPLAYA